MNIRLTDLLNSPEVTWDNIKPILEMYFGKGKVESINALMFEGFKESLTEKEKYQRIIIMLKALLQINYVLK